MAANRATKSFRDLSLTIAVDTSGSTAGKTLAAEVFAIRQVTRLLPFATQQEIPILPWSDDAPGVWSINDLNELYSGGGTDPSVLYDASSCVEALCSSDLWFLLTDGQIYDNLIQAFAERTAELGLHSRACVVVVFGSTADRPPAECDISVGKAAYALAPDCLFLFHDVMTSRLSILQAKGCFRKLLSQNGRTGQQPQLNEYTSWADLPHISYEDLAVVQVSMKQSVNREEMILDNDKVLNVQELYSGAAETETIEALLRSEDNMKSLVMAETARGRGKKLQEWLDSQQQEMPELSRDRLDINGAAQDAVNELLTIWNDDLCIDDRPLIQARLRDAHARNRVAFSGTIEEHENLVLRTRRKSTHVQAARRQSASMLPEDGRSNLRPIMQSRASSIASIWSAGWEDVDEENRNRVPPRSLGTRQPTVIKVPTEIFLPGFKRSSRKEKSECRGVCMLCVQESPLTILLTGESGDGVTQNFPRRGSATALTFPLAMSSFKETDVLSYFVCCDACAFYLVRNFTSPLGDRIAAALPLIDIKDNKDAWLSALDKSFKGCFADYCIFQVFVASLDNKIQTNKTRDASAEDINLFQRAALWAQNELLNLATAAPLLSAAFHKGRLKRKQHKSLSVLLEDDIFLDPTLLTNEDIAMLRYPISGFAVIIRLLPHRGLPKDKVRHFVFLRLLFEMIEAFLEHTRRGNLDILKTQMREMLESWSAPQEVTEAPSPLKPIRTLAEIELVRKESYIKLKELTGNDESVEWREAGIETFVQKLLDSGDKFEDAVKAFNTLKADPELDRVMHPYKVETGSAALEAEQNW